jgi:tetratricopeptide (TPR) repeat protein
MRALEIEPLDADLHLNLARAQFGMDDTTAAVASFKTALSIEPDNVSANFELGNQYEVQGKFDMARECYSKVLEIDPQKFEVHLRLASMGDTPVDEQAKVLDRLDEVLGQDDLHDMQRSRYLYAGAKIHQRLKNYDRAFEQFVAANAIEAEKHPFNRDMFMQWYRSQVRSFTPEVFETHKGAGDDTEQPIFIVGMPRSGTTLTEQIISSHPMVEGAGELQKLDQMIGAMHGIRDGALRYPDDVGRIERGALQGLAADYLASLRAQGRGEAARITDKYVFNFYHLGMIGILFPKAKIIHCKRDPLDTSLSCLFQNFSSSMSFPFWHKLEDIGFFYRHYQKMMDHWHRVLPVEILDVQYEETIADQEAMSRRLIDFVGLEWDDACLRFYENKRAVATASVWQVRQKVYTTSVQRWRAYEKHLDPLRRELAGEPAEPEEPAATA